MMSREQIIEAAKQGAEKASDPRGGKPVSEKHLRRLAELKAALTPPHTPSEGK